MCDGVEGVYLYIVVYDFHVQRNKLSNDCVNSFLCDSEVKTIFS
jgi:hypothetical protein